ncbi:hypothetical protein VOLCADRAFT_88105 [Volvox carteri f. nagariensis]|uniref:Protein kinase domain-containing protein n=1 Tax=Volvox carteri f. nagariensis TaxID=3068 RepID=D8TN34_VOLCA|nr:uncharacterized protein VOLCADRAFT_88105 [Volvox carteri f. nagariensis]EFJ51235.1 hypothetical protein VOLCADRAFT_88105 [Volvox carteri f. nagariensis]|eukprot:XP_002947702.1 hypothetical protein VOLCADRAFT_88105 [Volvox carteri f. nagariensis]
MVKKPAQLEADARARLQENEGSNRGLSESNTQQDRTSDERTGNLCPIRRSHEGAAASATGQAVPMASSSVPNGINASRIQDVLPENVTLCDARNVMEGLCLQQRELGRGTYGIVVPGTYRGVNCAVKIMLSRGLEKAAIREVLLSPRLVHPNTVLTYATRCAHLTHEFFDLLEGERDANRDPRLPRALEPVPLRSEDGFGDPTGLHDGSDPLFVLHQVLHTLGAETGKTVVIIIQEHCDRGTLDNAIRRNIFRPTSQWGLRLARRALLRTAAEIARGLLHLHDCGVVHGDFKPANVLLNSSREDRRGFVVKVADFGLAHVLPITADSLFTDSWGSIAYMAPEAFGGKVSRATDVWAFGVVLWEMLTAQRPFAGCRQPHAVRSC